ncbi:MAG: hypothetical protein FWE91_10175 [Defluviitaleaceae bacterium]|nr:hypothetical protein [Defluviitaleaceae bacterium]
MQSQFMAMQCISSGSSEIKETIFEERDKHIEQLRKMGADIKHEKGASLSVINGAERLTGAVVEATDLRAGAALILAGLAAEGETIIKNSEHVERGYEKIEVALSGLGAEIKLRNLN